MIDASTIVVLEQKDLDQLQKLDMRQYSGAVATYAVSLWFAADRFFKNLRKDFSGGATYVAHFTPENYQNGWAVLLPVIFAATEAATRTNRGVPLFNNRDGIPFMTLEAKGFRFTLASKGLIDLGDVRDGIGVTLWIDKAEHVADGPRAN